MNLLDKKFRPLAVILLSALIAISCEDPGRIGLIVNANNGVISTHYQDIVLPTTMVQFEPRKTSESNIVQCGKYTNPDFGVVTSMTYTQLGLSIVIPPEPTAEYTSFEVELTFTSFIGDALVSNENQSISIYQLAEEIDSTIEYTRIDTRNFNATPLGVWNFAPKLNDTIQSDSTYIIQLDDAVGQDLFDKYLAEDPIFASNAAFNAYFKGVAFVPTANNKNIFQINPTVVSFNLNYNEFNSDGTPIARSFEMSIGTTGFYYLDSDKTGTPISGINPIGDDFTPTDGYRYLQYGTMIALRADLTPFYLLKDSLDNVLNYVIVNKAEIYLGGVKQYGDDLTPPPFLRVYFTDETNIWPVVDNIGRFDTTQVGENFIMLQDESTFIPPGVYIAPLNTFYNSDNFNYRVNMSVFFQNLYGDNFHSLEEPYLEEKGQIYIFGETDVLFPQNTNSHVLATPMAIREDSIRLRIHYTIPTDQNQ